jgi:hypothetical protein
VNEAVWVFSVEWVLSFIAIYLHVGLRALGAERVAE